MGRVFNSISYKFKSSSSSFSSGSWSSTTSISLSAIYSKSKGVSSLLSQWSKSDQMWLEEKIKATAKTTFLKLQECWGKRDYSEMVPLMQTSLYNQHVAQLESMKLKHEINRLDGLELLDLQVVLVKNYHDKKKDEFVVWLKATARDTIIDDRTNQMIRGDSAKGTFEEFWSFRSDNDSWKLYLITQPEEGMNIIKAENFDSISTAGMVERQEQKTGGKKASTINVASIREQEVETANAPIDKIKWKAGRVSRLLNFLSDKDKSWNEDDLKSLVRTMFISLNTSIEACDISRIKPQLDPVFAAKTELTVSDYKSKNQRLEMRNLAVRDVEIVLVRNYYDNRKDEFVAWVSGQAQGVLVDSKSSSAISGDSFVKDFESFWTFKRSGDAWLLSNVEKGFAAPAYADEENFDEGSDKQLLEWYYTKDRAM